MIWGDYWKKKKKKKASIDQFVLMIKKSNFLSPKESYCILAITILGLLLPLSFLLLSRLSHQHYYCQLKCYGPLPITLDLFHQYPLLAYFLLRINPCILYLFALIFTLVTLLDSLIGKLAIFNRPIYVLKPRQYISWILLSTLQVSVGLGVGGSIAAGIFGESVQGLVSLQYDQSSFSGTTISRLSSVVFVFGLHETMRHWSRTVVKPAVDAGVVGFEREEGWVERVAGTAGLGVLWWWSLRYEVESMVGIFGRDEDVGLADIGGWWLYYLTVTVGMVRIVKGLIWIATLIFKRRGTRSDEPCENFNGNKL